MRKHSQSSKRRRSKSNRKDCCAESPRLSSQVPEPAGFLAAWHELISPSLWPAVGKRRGRKPRVPLANLVASQIFHVMNTAGTLGGHFGMLFEDALVDSSCLGRRPRGARQGFFGLMDPAVRPLGFCPPPPAGVF